MWVVLDKEYEVSKVVLFGAYITQNNKDSEQKIKLVYLNSSYDEVETGKKELKLKNDNQQQAETDFKSVIKMDAVGIKVNSSKLKFDQKLRLSGI